MSRKHNCPHRRTGGGYKRRLAARGVTSGPSTRMKYTGMTTEQIWKEFKREDALREKYRNLGRVI